MEASKAVLRGGGVRVHSMGSIQRSHKCQELNWGGYRYILCYQPTPAQLAFFKCK